MAVTLKGYTANYLGLSTDAKPTEADDNAIFRELDTGKRYYFTGAAWAEIPSSGGGGGGTTDYNALHNKPQINGETLTGNKTAADLHLLDENSNLTNEQMNDLLAIIG